MPRINVSWTPAVGENPTGHRIHAGPVSGLYTEVSGDFAMPLTSGYIDVSAAGTWYLAVAPYDASGYEGMYSDEFTATAGTAPMGTLVLARVA